MSLRLTAKLLLTGLSLIVTAPLIVVVWMEGKIFGATGLYRTSAQLLALAPGPVGHYLRAAFYFAVLDSCDWQTHIGFGTLFSHRHARVGAHFSTGAYCMIGHVAVGTGVRLASMVSIPSGRRQHLDDSGRLSAESNFDTVTIGDGCWIGEGAIVMADVGKHCIISAGSVVLNDIPEASIAGGNPARVLKQVETKPDSDGKPE